VLQTERSAGQICEPLAGTGLPPSAKRRGTAAPWRRLVTARRDD
jgi:hypothetical protein